MPHTPGPWSIDKRIPREAIARVRSKDGDPIADVFGIDMGNADDNETQDEAKANALLIATAPELLALLAKTSRMIQLAMQTNPELSATYEEIRAAITKAKGNT